MADSQNSGVGLQLSFLDQHGQRKNTSCVITPELHQIIERKKLSDPAFDDAAAAAIIKENFTGLIQAEIETTTRDGKTVGKEWHIVKDGFFEAVYNDAGIYYREETNGRLTFCQQQYEGNVFRETRWDDQGVITEDNWYKISPPSEKQESIAEPVPHPPVITRNPPIFTSSTP